MTSKFIPSVNIINAHKQNFDFLVTKNNLSVSDSIYNSFKSGYNCFTLIGSYGTGKSAFLVALEKSIIEEKIFFESAYKLCENYKNKKVLKILGEYTDFEEYFFDQLSHELNYNFSSLENLVTYLDENKNVLYVVLIDEFGKFLEYIANNNPKQKIYFFQKLAESTYNKNILFVFTLHQNFNAYVNALNEDIKTEWKKVRGRFKELTFNESPEKLIYFASKYIKKFNHNSFEKTRINHLNSLIIDNNFINKEDIDENLLYDILPFDITSLKILILALIEYGQNERSIFNFLLSKDRYSISDFSNYDEFYTLVEVFDYLYFNLHPYIFSKDNHNFLQWSSIRSSLERVESSLNNNFDLAKNVVKIIGLLNIFSTDKGNLTKDFIIKYLFLSKGIDKNETNYVLNELEKKKIIRFLNFKNRYILFEGTDIDIEFELTKAASNVEYGKDFIKKIKVFIKDDLVLAKKHFIKTGTPRFFKYIVSEDLTKKFDNSYDGYINLIFKEECEIDDLLNQSNADYPVLYCLFKDTKKIKDLVFQHDKAKYLLAKITDDLVAIRELKKYLKYIEISLKEYILESLFTDKVTWFSNGKVIYIDNPRKLNNYVTYLCENYYNCTPIIKNELINRNKSSAAISNALNNFLIHLITYYEKKDLGFPENKFPPEKFIYKSLLKDSLMHRYEEGSYLLKEPQRNLNHVWKASVNFLKSTTGGKKSIKEFIDLLKKPPFGLKQTVIDFWIPIFLVINQDSYALYGEDNFIPMLDVDILKIIRKQPEKYFIKAFAIDNIKLNLFNTYRKLVNQDLSDEINKRELIGAIAPFLAFIKQLPDYTKFTKKLSQPALSLRDTLLSANDIEKLMFDDIPNLLGYDYNILKNDQDALSRFSVHLVTIIKEIKQVFLNLIERVESVVLSTLKYRKMDYSEYKSLVFNRFNNLDTKYLNPTQKLFFEKLLIDSISREQWIVSLSYPLIGKNLDKIRDDEEPHFLKLLESTLRTLDNYVELQNQGFKPEKKLYKIDITTPNDNLKSLIVMLEKDAIKESELVLKKIKKLLYNKNNDIISYITLNLLEDLINEKD